MVIDRCGGTVRVSVSREDPKKTLIVGHGPIPEPVVGIVGGGMFLREGAGCLLQGDGGFLRRIVGIKALNNIMEC